MKKKKNPDHHNRENDEVSIINSELSKDDVEMSEIPETDPNIEEEEKC